MTRVEGTPVDFFDEHDELSTDAVVTYLASYITPRCPMAGVYKVARRHLASGRVPDDGQLASALDELESANLLYYRGKVVWVVDRVARLTTKSSQMARSVAKGVTAVEGTEIYAAFVWEYSSERRPWLVAKLEEANANFDKKPPQFEQLIADLRRASGEPRPTLGRTSADPRERAQTSQVANPRPSLGRGSLDEDEADDVAEAEASQSGSGERRELVDEGEDLSWIR